MRNHWKKTIDLFTHVNPIFDLACLDGPYNGIITQPGGQNAGCKNTRLAHPFVYYKNDGDSDKQAAISSSFFNAIVMQI